MNPAADPRLKPPCTRDDALAVLQRLCEAGHIAYFAGGCVRDVLLGLDAKDWDVATDAPPSRVRELFPSTQAVGAAFGVILVRSGHSVVEVATFRADGTYEDGRRPSSVRFTSAEEDARRRDFTINGLFLDPIEDRIIDFVGGRDDLAARRIRAIGSPAERFGEDHLRMLRAVRFAARFGFEIEPATAAAIQLHAPKIKGISPERIGEELRLMLKPPTREAAWVLLWDLHLAREIFRFLPAVPEVLDEARSIFLKLERGRPISLGLSLAAACLCTRLQGESLGDVLPLLAKNEISRVVRAMRQALRISNDECDEMTQTLAILEPLLKSNPPTLAQKKRFLAHPKAGLSRQLMESIASAGPHQNRIASLQEELPSLGLQDVAPIPLLDGDDLIAAGFPPGPAFRRILDAVYDAQLEGRISTKEQAMKLAKTL
ncbi:MAG: CCA tRNA nucleotidyltransferase [Tepidisphaeraceae bacterium]